MFALDPLGQRLGPNVQRRGAIAYIAHRPSLAEPQVPVRRFHNTETQTLAGDRDRATSTGI